MENFARLPLAFERNRGQVQGDTNFIARGSGFEAFLDPAGATLALGASQSQIAAPVKHQSVTRSPRPVLSEIRMNLEGASHATRAEAEDRLPGVVNYYRGNDRSKWHRDVPTYARVRYAEVYRGIDLAYYGDRGTFEFDFDVKPGADARSIALSFDGIDGADLTAEGAALLKTAHGNLTLQRPLAYQDVDGVRSTVAANYKIYRHVQSTRISIALGDYDHSRAITIDPVLLFSTFFGGTTTDITGAALDSSGNVYVTGFAFDCPTCAHFPTTGGQVFAGDTDAFVSEISSNGSTLLYSTLIGGSNFEEGKAVAVDGSGDAYMTGVTFSTDFPETVGPVSAPGNGDAFVAKFGTDGSVTWATYLGGSEFDEPYSLALAEGCSSNCNAYVAGQTESSNFPGATGFTGQNDAFITEMQADGSGEVYTKLIAGNTGPSGAGSGLTFATGIAVDSGGRAFVAGGTDASDFPKSEGSSLTGSTDAWAAKLGTTGTLTYARLLGGSDFDQAEGIAIKPGCADPCSAYLEGVTFSADFPTNGGLGTSLTGVAAEFIAELTGDGSSTVYSTLLEASDSPLFGAISGIAVDTAGDAFVIGSTSSASFALHNPVDSFPGPNGAVFQFEEGSPGPTPTPVPNQLTWPSTNGSALTIQEGNSSNQVVIGTTNGLFVSTDGTTFTRVAASGLPSGAVPAADYETSLTPNVIFAGTASGLYISSNMGATFSSTGFTKPVEVVVDIAGSSLSNTDVLVGTIGSGAWASINGGTSFTQIASLPTTATIFSLASSAKDGGQVFVGTSRGVYTSANVTTSFPGTWSATNFAMAAVSSVNSDRNSTPPVIYAGTYFQGLYESTDNFSTFVRANIPQFSYSALEVDRDNGTTPSTVFAGVNALDQAYVYQNPSGYGGAFFETNFANQPGSVKGLKNPYVGELLQFHPVIAELNPSATNLTFSSYLAGTSYDSAGAIAVDPTGTDIYVAGTTYSSDFKTQGTQVSSYHGFASGFVAKMGPVPSGSATATSTGSISATPTATATPNGAKISAPTKVVLRPAGIGVSPGTSGKILIRNIGKGDLIGNISLTNQATFMLSSPGPFTIPPRGMLPETITFTPSATSNSATLSIVSNDATKGSLSIPVSGIGEPGKLSVPRTLTIVGTAIESGGMTTFQPGTGKLVLRNVGKGVLTGSVAAATAPFSDGGGGMGTIQPGKTNPPITITFTPTSTTTVTQSLLVTAQPPNTGTTTVTLKGIVKVKK